MNEVRTAVKMLLEDNRTILPDALEILKTTADPIGLAERVITQTTSATQVDRKILQTYIRNPAPTQTPVTSPPTAPRTRRRARVMDSILSRSAKPAKKEVIKRPSMPSSRTRIHTELGELDGLHNYESDLQIIRNPQLSPNLAGDIQDMVGYFQDRFKKLYRIFRLRTDITNMMKIKDLKQNHRDITVVGMVTEKNFSTESTGKIILEDPSTEKILEAVIANNETLVEQANQIMTDTVICIRGMMKNYTFYAQEFILPDIPYMTQKKKADVPVHAAFLSDIHVGSKGFLSDPMEKFVQFLNGEYGDIKHQKLGEHTKYVMFSGDVVDGVGIYPNQHDDLAIDSIQDQYNAFASFVDRIPDDVEVVVIPGNHDMVRSAEPQPAIIPEHAPDLATFENVRLLPNPSQVALHGVQTLLYHCTSLPDIMNHIPGLPIEKPVDVMVHMLKARHLAPIWGDKTPIATEPEDHLVIDPIPDIFHGGHIHINGYGGYRGVQIINSGTMQEQTSYQKSLNIDPTPGLVPLVNLKTRKPSIIDFISK